MKNSTLYKSCLLFVLASMLFSACGTAKTPQPATEPSPGQQSSGLHGAPTAVTLPEVTLAPTAVPSATLPPETAAGLTALIASAAGAPPVVVAYKPALGEEARPKDPVELTFDRPMDQVSVEQAFTLTGPDGAAVAGQFSWPGGNAVQFKPAQALQKGSAYEATLDASAKGADGLTLNNPLSLRFTTVTPLQVSQVFPAANTTEIDPGSRITVMFNRPVVPLGIAEDQSKLPQPLAISPQVSGAGEWINTSVYVFQPDPPLKTGMTYTVRVGQGLADASDDSKLAEDMTWSFAVRPPSVLRITAGDYSIDAGSLDQVYTNLPQDPAIKIEYQQRMDPEATVRAVHLSGAGQSDIPFSARWEEDNTILTIKPQIMLTLNSNYLLVIGGVGADGGAIAEPLQWSFRTIPAPAVASTRPANGEGNYADTSFMIKFVSPMDPETISDHVIFQPEIENLNSWYSPYDDSMNFYSLAPSTTYTVTLQAGMRDKYGNAINRDTVVTFTTAPAAPSAMLNMPYAPMFRTGVPNEFYVEHTNVNSIHFDLYRMSAIQFMNYQENGKPLDEMKFTAADLAWQYDLDARAALNERARDAIALKQPDGSPVPAGFYYLGMTSPDVQHTGKYVDGRFLAITQTNLTLKSSPGDALVWATDPQTGKPAAGVNLKIFRRTTQVGEGSTGADGTLYLEFPYDPDQTYSNYYAVSEGQITAFTSSNYTSSVSAYDFNIMPEYSDALYNATAYIYTERPLYRPGQPVYFKGIVRVDDDLNYKLPDKQQVVVTITSYEGEEVYHETLPLSDYGAFDATFQLDEGAALGNYTISAKFPGADRIIGSLSFTAAEYRKPEFQIDLSMDPGDVLMGQKFNANLDAAYYSGGGLSQAQVDWQLFSQPFNYTPPQKYSQYSFYDDARDAGLDREGQPEQISKAIAEGQASTDENGKLRLALTADPAGLPGSRTLMFFANITDFAGTQVGASGQVIAHRSLVYAGARPKDYVGTAGKEQTFQLVALDWDGNPLANQTLKVDISERQWYSVQELDAQGVLRWKTSVKDIPAASFDSVTTNANGEASVSFTPDHGGVYRALVTVYDRNGNPNRAAAYLWVAGSDYIPWRQANDNSFQLIADKDNYQPGDTAQLLIASPFQGTAYALITVERGKVRSREVVQLNSNSTIYQLPVTADMAPVVYASVLIVKGVDANNPRPAYKVGMAQLNVSTEQQTLNVKLSADPPQAAPGEQVKYTVETSDAGGKPVQADVSLGLSDLATLSLLDMNSPRILDFFYAKRGLSVNTALSLAASMEEFNANLKEQLQGGRGQGSGGKGGGEPGVPDVRQNFLDTAFWQASVRTDASGKASVNVTLPDNLTTWRMDARADTLDTRVGQTTLDLVSTRPLLVRPQAPRFFVAGDKAVLGAAVHNNTGQDLTVEVGLQAQGVRLDGQATQTVSIANGQQAYVGWNVSVPSDSKRVDLVFSASGGGFQDASRPTLGTLDNQGIPVYRYEAPETVGTAGELASEGSRTEAVRLPDQFDVTSGQLSVKIEPSLAAGMVAGLKYLEQYPYECTEQTVSRFLANLFAYQALQAAGAANPNLTSNLQSLVNSAVQRLYNQQKSDGGWGWWSSGPSDPLTSAYVVLGLVEAKKSDYAVDASVLGRGITYLQMNGLNAPSDNQREAVISRNRLAFVLYALANAGYPDVNKTVSLYDQREWLSLYAKGFLAQTLSIIDAQDPRLDVLRSELVDAVDMSATGAHWQEHSTDLWNWNSDTRSTAIVLDTLIQLDPSNPINANSVRWLMHTRKEGHWESTQETVWTVKALTNWIGTTGELQADYAYGVALNGEDLAKGAVTPQTVQDTQTLQVQVSDLLKGEINRLVFARTSGGGNLYYTTHLTVDLPVPQIQALDQGIVLQRRYFQPDDLKTAITEAQQGDVVTVQLTIVVPNDMHYLLVDDPLPAGLEAIDSSLKSSPMPTAPDQYDWQKVGSEGWGWWYFPHVELRDEKVVLSTDYLPAGTYVYTYQARASTAGAFQVIPPTAQEFYFPEVYGRGAGSLFTVKP